MKGRNRLLSDVVVRKGSTHRCIEWSVIHKNGPMLPRLPVPQNVEKNYQDYCETGALTTQPHENAISSGCLLSGCCPHRSLKVELHGFATGTITNDVLLWIAKICN